MALEPPPTHATTASGNAPSAARHWARALSTDDLLQTRNQSGVRVRTGGAADAVIGGTHVRHPVPQRLVHRVFQGARAGADRQNAGSEHAHPRHVGRLAFDVDLAHVDFAREPEKSGGGRRRDAVLPGAGLGDDAPLSHAQRQKDLPQGVVDLVRAGVTEIFAFEQELADDARLGIERGGEAPCSREGRGAPDVVAQKRAELGLVRLGIHDRRHGERQLVQGGDERLGDESPAVGTEIPGQLGLGHDRGSSISLPRETILDSRALKALPGA